jgi:hypothetical protein
MTLEKPTLGPEISQILGLKATKSCDSFYYPLFKCMQLHEKYKFTQSTKCINIKKDLNECGV